MGRVFPAGNELVKPPLAETTEGTGGRRLDSLSGPVAMRERASSHDAILLRRYSTIESHGYHRAEARLSHGVADVQPSPA